MYLSPLSFIAAVRVFCERALLPERRSGCDNRGRLLKVWFPHLSRSQILNSIHSFKQHCHDTPHNFQYFPKFHWSITGRRGILSQCGRAVGKCRQIFWRYESARVNSLQKYCHMGELLTKCESVSTINHRVVVWRVNETDSRTCHLPIWWVGMSLHSMSHGSTCGGAGGPEAVDKRHLLTGWSEEHSQRHCSHFEVHRQGHRWAIFPTPLRKCLYSMNWAPEQGGWGSSLVFTLIDSCATRSAALSTLSFNHLYEIYIFRCK